MKCSICENEKLQDEFYYYTHKKSQKRYYKKFCKLCSMEKYHGVKLHNKNKYEKIIKKCELCSKEFIVSLNTKLFKKHCSKECRYEVQSRLFSLRQEIGQPVGTTNFGFY